MSGHVRRNCLDLGVGLRRTVARNNRLLIGNLGWNRQYFGEVHALIMWGL
jgi:hypothetical protein